MKQWGWVLSLCVISFAVYVSADEFKFVSVLSSPVASFDQVETKACVTTEPKGEFNAGSGASSGGTINVNGAPIQVGSLFMEKDTKITTGDSQISWLVNQLQVGSAGRVEVKKLIANTIVLDNNAQGVSLKGSSGAKISNLIINNSAWTEDGEATSTLKVYRGNDGKFEFAGGSEPTSTAQWIQVGTGSGESVTYENAVDTYFPITTAQ